MGAGRAVSRCVNAESARLTALLTAASAGDESAFGELYDAIGERVFGVVAMIVGHVAPAADVTRDAFHEAWLTATRFDTAGGSARLGAGHRPPPGGVVGPGAAWCRGEPPAGRFVVRPLPRLAHR